MLPESIARIPTFWCNLIFANLEGVCSIQLVDLPEWNDTCRVLMICQLGNPKQSEDGIHQGSSRKWCMAQDQRRHGRPLCFVPAAQDKDPNYVVSTSLGIPL